MSARRSLVTGGGGFIGRHLVRQLRADGDAVRVLDLDPPSMEDVEAVRGSICDAAAVRAALRGVDRLFHLAAIPELWVRDKADFDRVNHEGTRTVLEQAAACDLERIVHTSTESIMAGRHRRRGDERPLDGRARLRVEDVVGPYCRSKLRGELAAAEAAGRGLPVVIVRPTLPVGPEDVHLTPPTRMLMRYRAGGGRVYLEFHLNLVDVRDVARGHVLAAERGRIGERYILGHQNLKMSELLALLDGLAGTTRRRVRIPYPVAMVAAAASEWTANHLTRRRPEASLTGVRLAAAPMYFDSTQAVRELGFPQTPIREALADALEWLASGGPEARGRTPS